MGAQRGWRAPDGGEECASCSHPTSRLGQPPGPAWRQRTPPLQVSTCWGWVLEWVQEAWAASEVQVLGLGSQWGTSQRPPDVVRAAELKHLAHLFWGGLRCE